MSAQTKALRASDVQYRRLFQTATLDLLSLDVETRAVADAKPYVVELLELSSKVSFGERSPRRCSRPALPAMRPQKPATLSSPVTRLNAAKQDLQKRKPTPTKRII